MSPFLNPLNIDPIASVAVEVYPSIYNQLITALIIRRRKKIKINWGRRKTKTWKRKERLITQRAIIKRGIIKGSWTIQAAIAWGIKEANRRRTKTKSPSRIKETGTIAVTTIIIKISWSKKRRAN